MWDLEWWVNRALDVVLPPVAALVLLFWSPVLGLLNLLLRTWNWMRAPSLRGKVVLITGASSGIGEHLAYEFAKRRARLVLTGQRVDRLRRVGQACDRLGAEEYHICEGDTAKEIDCRRMVDTALNSFGQLDVLVNNAGIAHADLFKDTRSIEALRQVVDVDFFGYVWMTLHALPYLRRSGGYILVNASVDAFLPMPRHTVYSAAKGAVLQFFDTLRTEPVGRDVSITVVFPGAVASELTAGKVLDPHGRMVVDQEKRDVFLGPQPMLRTTTAAKRMVSGMLSRAHYVVVPFWFSLPLLLRVFTPEVLFLALKAQFMPWMAGTKPPAKILMDATGAPKVLFHPPATSHAEAEAAVVEGKGVEGKQEGVLDKAVKVVQQTVQPQEKTQTRASKGGRASAESQAQDVNKPKSVKA